MNSNRKTSKIITAVFASLAVGAAVWYLYKTDKVRQNSKLWSDSLEELTNSFKDKAMENFSGLLGETKR